MKPEAQRIAIAQACGWTEVEACSCREVPHGKAPRQEAFQHLPDYINDLNACHEMEKVLPALPYLYRLQEVCGGQMNTSGDLARIIKATAAQRAEAFLRCIGKWQEEPKEQLA